MKRNRIILLVLSVLVFISGLHLYFKSGQRADIFIFYEYPNGRYLSNIFYDFSNMITISVILFLWWKWSVKSTRKIILPFLFVSLLDIIDYVLFYKQYAVIKLLVLLALILIYNIPKQKKK